MAITYPELKQQYGGDERIPDAVLYDYIQETRKAILDLFRKGTLSQTELYDEVQRRSKSDLFWMARYFTWETNPVSAGRPVSENRVTEEEYRVVCDFFVHKRGQEPIVQQDTIKTRLLLWPRGGFKALDLDTEIPTPDGLKLLRNLQVGDRVFGADGNPCQITGESAVFTNRRCFEIVFSTGETVIADAEHLWVTDSRRDRDRTKRRNGGKTLPAASIKTTQEIARTLKCRKEYNHRVKLAAPLSLPDQSYPVSPYVLGCWLGDGTSANSNFTCADPQIVEEIRKEGEPIRKAPYGEYLYVCNGGPGHPHYRKHSGQSLASRLRHLDVLNNKHIPEQYFRGSSAQRLALLQGLMDTDGTCDARGHCTFSTTKRQLAEQVRRLAASLGLKPFAICEGAATLEGVAVGRFYQVGFIAYRGTNVFRLARKQARLQPRKRTSLSEHRQIVAVREVDPRPTKCLVVDSPDRTYLVGQSCIPTHNSTIDICDTVQWILNWPEIRILFLTATDDLATGFVDEVKGHFVIREGRPSLMNLFFPEFCLSESELGNKFEFTCPVWAARQTQRKEPTVMASSVGSTKSGMHFELIKADDAVSDKNTESPEQCASVSEKLDLAENLLNPGGYYVDYIGTRYADEDHYGVRLEKNIGDLTVEKGRGWTLTTNTTTGMKVLIGRAITIKPEVAAQLEKDGKPVTYQNAGEAGCELLIPHVMPYAWLMGDFSKNEKIFEGQKNQNPRPASITTFDRPLLLRSTVSFQEMPFRGPVSQTWDFAFSKKKGRDYSTGSSAIWDEKGKCYIHDIIRARFKPNDLAKAVVDLARKWRPYVIGIEDAAGSKFLEPTIIAEALKTNDPYVIQVRGKIDWFTPDNQFDAKKMRMAALHPWLINERLKFANYLPVLEILYSEFEKCLTSHHHDDIPDVISQQPRYAPRMQQLIDQQEVSAMSQTDAAWNLLFEDDCDAFGRPGMGTPLPVVELEPEPEVAAETSAPGMDPILGAGLFG